MLHACYFSAVGSGSVSFLRDFEREFLDPVATSVIALRWFGLGLIKRKCCCILG